MLQYITADRIHDGHRFLPEDSVIALNAALEIAAVLSKKEVSENQAIRHFEGTLCPGLVNAHCHLELSHLKGAIPEDTGLVEFLQKVVQHRNTFSPEEKAEALRQAVDASLRNGIVAVGDIANTTDTLAIRENGQLHIHSFIESIGFQEQQAVPAFERSLQIFEQFAQQKTTSDHLYQQSIVPHAPYSVSTALFALISRHEASSVMSVHNEESPAENEYFRYKTGVMKNLYAALHIDEHDFTPSGKTSLQTWWPYCSETRPVMLVHNTFMEPEDIALLNSSGREIYLCLCPNANWYIERRFPPVYELLNSGIPVCIGTDSLASNRQLDIFSELKTLKKHFPKISWETLLHCATLQGARALGMAQQIGSFEKGKRPGFCLINTAMTEAGSLEL